MRTLLVGLLAALVLTLPLTATAAPAVHADAGFYTLPDWLAAFLAWMGLDSGPASGTGIGPHMDPHGRNSVIERGPAMDPHGLAAAGAGRRTEAPEIGPAMDPNGRMAARAS